MKETLKRLVRYLPTRWQLALRRWQYDRQIRNGRFVSPEPEYAELHRWVAPGDRVLDVGANVGLYTARLSALVGRQGHVTALEPVPVTHDLLSGNVRKLGAKNVTLLSVAASSAAGRVRMTVPKMKTGLDSFYEARMAEDGELLVDAVTIDELDLDGPISLAKLDVEGHEYEVIRGMARLVERDRPTLIIEGDAEDVAEFLATYGYEFTEDRHSPNRVFTVKRPD